VNERETQGDRDVNMKWGCKVQIASLSGTGTEADVANNKCKVI